MSEPSLAELVAAMTPDPNCPLCKGTGIAIWFPVGGGDVTMDRCPKCEDTIPEGEEA
jgi:tartrate dehydratase alpha subunit/fumarate hydratase class I-like protein